MHFTIHLHDSRVSTVDHSYGLVFIPSPVFLQGATQLLNLNPHDPAYQLGSIAKLLDHTGSRQHFTDHPSAFVIVHDGGHGTASDLEQLGMDLGNEGFRIHLIVPETSEEEVAADSGLTHPSSAEARSLHEIEAKEDWDHLQSALIACLQTLEEDEYLILARKDRNVFVQFAGQGQFGLRAEATSNAFIEPPTARLTVPDYELMDSLGWRRATNPAPVEGGEEEPATGSPNFYIDLREPVDMDAVAAIAMRTLREVYGVGHPLQLHYSAFNSESESIRFPTLRLKRRVG